MKVTIIPAPLSGTMNIPPSKSYSHRALICAALGGGEAVGVGNSADIRATAACLSALKTGAAMDANESGSTLRFMIPIALAVNGRLEIHGSKRLMERPLDDYFNIFNEQGIKYELKDSTLTAEGRLRGGDYRLRGDVSSQFITGLLFALPMLENDSRIIITTALESKAYVDMTVEVLKNFGIDIAENESGYYIKGGQRYHSGSYTVEGDFSQAGFFLAMGEVDCLSLNHASIQGDRASVEVYRSMGMDIEEIPGGYRTNGRAVRPVTVDAAQIPDFVPVLACVMATAEGESRIINAGRLRIKESDRLAAIAEELGKLGADVEEGADYLIIRGGKPLHGAECSAHNDHRIAMALATISPHVEGELTIDGAESVNKSMPDFWERFKALGGRIK
ncbi:MAG: 3-phosphoshikimate 1-carboxyvinyltransferase [Oscillospiraceae bacterium]|nr:3-phosphoshikimate 1-carboxyvinyltransferase [Oscillospiraceae bacterium]